MSQIRTVSQAQGQASRTSGKALLFDIDGTLADTDPLHLAAFNQVLGPHGHAFDHAPLRQGIAGLFQRVDRRALSCS